MTLAVGIIGTGIMGAEHLRLLREEVGGARVVAICDADPARAAALAQGAAVQTDPAALIADPAVEAVVIAAPDALHAPLALACIAAGKPALCEKPLAPTAAAAWAVVEAEVAAGRRLVQVGYMRRHDPAYAAMKAALAAGQIGPAAILHNIHRNAAAPDWFTGPMAITNSFVHEIDISRWLLGSEMVTAQVHACPGGDPLLVTMTTDRGEIVSTEVHMNAGYGYHVHAQLVGRAGTVEMAAPAEVLVNRAGQHGHDWADNWVPRFRAAYRRQMAAWVRAASGDRPGHVPGDLTEGASAWDGFVATALAEQVVAALASGQPVPLTLPAARPALYA